MITRPADPILTRFRTALVDVYGPRLERVVLYGSRARGDDRRDSDYDVAVFLREMANRPAEMGRLADIATDVLYDLGGVIHAMSCVAGTYNERGDLREAGPFPKIPQRRAGNVCADHRG